MSKKKNNILVVDDDTTHRSMLKTLLNKWGYTIFEADDGSTAIERVKERAFDLILMDIRMIKVSGLEALAEIKEINSAIPVIIMTAFSSVDTAIDALKKGAYDYLTKPFDFEKLKLTIKRSLEHTLLKKENELLRETLGKNFDRSSIIGNSKKMKRLIETVSLVAPSDATVLVTGESGTGKELISGAVHYNSERKDKPYVKINCGALTETLLESELFGHVKGAFTGANRNKDGRFKQADGGSLFLDEIGETSKGMQVKLLRALQEGEISPVGGEKIVKVNVRIIAATNKKLADMVKNDEFREDLYYRLNVINLEIPPLRERSSDIPILAAHFLKHYNKKNNKKIDGFTPDAMDFIMKYSWPGNIRELMNTIERSVILTRGDFVGKDDLQIHFDSGDGIESELLNVDEANMPETLHEVEKIAILRVLEKTGGNKSATARRLGITRRTLHLKLKEYGVMP
jgi:two-component system response regulator HydG